MCFPGFYESYSSIYGTRSGEYTIHYDGISTFIRLTSRYTKVFEYFSSDTHIIHAVRLTILIPHTFTTF